MNIHQAIETLTDQSNTHTMRNQDDLIAAMKLGIEALKHLQYERDRRIGFWTDPIPGESEE